MHIKAEYMESRDKSDGIKNVIIVKNKNCCYRIKILRKNKKQKSNDVVFAKIYIQNNNKNQLKAE